MVMAHPYVSELPSIWFDKWRCDDAEKLYQETQSGAQAGGGSSLVTEIAKARRQIQNSLKSDSMTIAGGVENEVIVRLENIEIENKELRKVTDDLRQVIKNLENRISAMEKSSPAKAAASPAKPAAKQEESDDEDDFELFGSDEEEDEAAAKLKEERLAAYAEKKTKKPQLIAKSGIVLDVKPWDDETDMKEMERCVRTVTKDGLVWGASKLVPLAFGIKKLQISCVVEDDKVGTDDLEEEITAFEELVQSVDIAAFNKI